MSLLSLVVTACGLALFGVSLFVSWKLCWIPWRERAQSPGIKEGQPEHSHPPPPPLQPQPIYTEVDATLDRRTQSRGSVVKEMTVPPTPVSPPAPGSPPPVPVPETTLKISHTSPDIPLEAESKAQENGVYGSRGMQRQTTDPSSTCVRSVQFFLLFICKVFKHCHCFSIKNLSQLFLAPAQVEENQKA